MSELLDRYESVFGDGALEIPFEACFTEGLGHPVGDKTVRQLYEESYGEKGENWFPRFSKATLGGVAIIAIVVTAAGLEYYRRKYGVEE